MRQLRAPVQPLPFLIYEAICMEHGECRGADLPGIVTVRCPTCRKVLLVGSLGRVSRKQQWRLLPLKFITI